MEKGDILFPRFDSGMKGDVSQGIHDLGNIDVVWTSHTAGVAGRTDPYGFGRKDSFSMVVLDMAEDLVRKDVHGISHGASR